MARFADTASNQCSMSAIVQDGYGTVDVFRPERISRPEIAGDEVLVEVRAAGMDRGTWHMMTGRPLLMRLIGFGFRRPKRRVPGFDVAGVVVRVGAGVNRFRPGDEVFGTSRGSYAAYAAAKEDTLAPKPAGLTFEQAAVVPVSASTALQALRDAGRVTAGDHVLVVGASGGVGTYAVQLAKALGAEVTAVASASKLDLLRTIGADHVVDYTVEDVADRGACYDVIIDIGGSRPVSRLREALSSTGTLVIAGGEHGGNLTGGLHRQLQSAVLSPFIGQRLTMVANTENHADLEVLAEHIEAGRIAPVLDRSYSLTQVAEAMQHLETGRVRGKLAITI